jgi:uncharacterized protein YigA (DUF484 family)
MTTREARGLPAANAEEESIARYLQHNPDFFERHQALLARLRLPHSRGGSTISLVERQIEVMRERHAALEAKLAELVRVARDNDAIAERFHRFARRLLRATSRQAALDEIEASLRDDFDAFHSVLLLVGSTPQESTQRFPRSIASDDPNLKSFESLFASAKPRCGQVRDTQREFLFGSDANDIGSVALVPLGEKGSLGLLALGSTERDRFHPGMSTEFLGRMADLIADAVARQ